MMAAEHADVYAIQQRAGHKNIPNTMIYTHVSEERASEWCREALMAAFAERLHSAYSVTFSRNGHTQTNDLGPPETPATFSFCNTLARRNRPAPSCSIRPAVSYPGQTEWNFPHPPDALSFHGARRLTIWVWDALKASHGSVVLISGRAALDPKPGFCGVGGDQRGDHCYEDVKCLKSPLAPRRPELVTPPATRNIGLLRVGITFG
jgi:hypothetical protein